MPNWVFNTLVVSGDKVSLDAMQEQLNQPVTKHFPDSNYDKELEKWVETPATQVYSNPVFSFWNVIAPTNLEAYYGEETEKFGLDNFAEGFKNAITNDQSSYWWNSREWGTKWDIAVADGVEYPDTTLEVTDEGSLLYHFNTAWSPVEPVIETLSKMYPSLSFDYEYEEEQGWGGSILFENGEIISQNSYDIPASHADYQNHPFRECNCETDYDPAYWFVDCPIDTNKYELLNGEWVEKEGVEA